MRGLRGAGAVAVLCGVLLSACGRDEEPEPTPEEAFASASAISTRILTEVVPDGELSEAPVPQRGTPCGGLGGNEWSRIKHTYVAGAGPVDDAEATLARAVEVMDRLGVDHDGIVEGGPSWSESIPFRGPGYRLSVYVDDERALRIGGATACLRNHDR